MAVGMTSPVDPTTANPLKPTPISTIPTPAHETTHLLPKPSTTKTPPSPTTTHLKGFFYIALSATAYSAVSVLVRLAESRYTYPPIASVFLRGILLTAFTTTYLLSTTHVPTLFSSLTSKQRLLLIIRGLSGGFAVWAQYTAFKYVQVGQVISLFSTTPLFTLVFSRVILGEPATMYDGIFATLAVCGVALIVHPSLLATVAIQHSSQFLGIGLSVASAVLSAISYTAIRSLGTAVPVMLSVFALSVGTIVITVGLALVFEPAALIVGGYGSAIIALASLFSVFAQSGLNYGLQLCPAGPGSILANLDVPIVYLLGLLFLGETASMEQLAGSGLVVVSAALVGLQRLLKK